MSSDLCLFFLLTGLSAVLLGLLISPAIESTHAYAPGLLPRYFGVFVVATFIIEVMLNGLPLFRVLGGENFWKGEAEATHLHLFVFWTLYSVIRFADFLYSRRPLYLLESAIPLVFYVALLYRGPALILFTAWTFTFVIHQKAIRARHVVAVLALALTVLYANGRLGDLRSPGHEDMGGSPTPAFTRLEIPHSYFWTYLYVAAPLGNFQLAVDQIEQDQGTFAEFVATELIVDTFSRRLIPFINPAVEPGKNPRSEARGNKDYFETRDQLYSWRLPNVAHGMNIATLFGRSYGYFGWFGPIIMFCALSAFIIAYIAVTKLSPYRVPCLALLNTLVVFCLFNNMLASAVMLPPLIIVLLLPPWGWLRPHRDRLLALLHRVVKT